MDCCSHIRRSAPAPQTSVRSQQWPGNGRLHPSQGIPMLISTQAATGNFYLIHNNINSHALIQQTGELSRFRTHKADKTQHYAWPQRLEQACKQGRKLPVTHVKSSTAARVAQILISFIEMLFGRCDLRQAIKDRCECFENSPTP